MNEPQIPSDEQLMVRVQAHDANAFEQLYDRYSARAYRLARSICPDKMSAEDAVQEGFLAIWRSRASYRPGLGSFAAWTMGIVRNRAIDSVRQDVVRRRLRQTIVHEKPSPHTHASSEEEVVANARADALIGALRQLPAAQKEVLALAFFGGLSHSEIASQLELPQGTVKGRMRLGLQKLRLHIDEGAPLDPYLDAVA